MDVPRHRLVLTEPFDGRPTLTVEAYCKWYELWLLLPDGGMRAIDFGQLETVWDFGRSPAFVDHVPNPAAVEHMCARHGWVFDDTSHDLIAGRWVREVEGRF